MRQKKQLPGRDRLVSFKELEAEKPGTNHLIFQNHESEQ